MHLLWEDLKMIFGIIAVILVIGVIYFYFFLEATGSFVRTVYTNDTNNTNKEVVDYDTYVRDNFNPNFNKNTQVVEKDNSDDYTITSDDLQLYKQKNKYIP